MLYFREYSRATKHFASAYSAGKQENHCFSVQSWPISLVLSYNRRKEQIMDVDIPHKANILSTLVNSWFFYLLQNVILFILGFLPKKFTNNCAIPVPSLPYPNPGILPYTLNLAVVVWYVLTFLGQNMRSIVWLKLTDGTGFIRRVGRFKIRDCKLRAHALFKYKLWFVRYLK